MELARPGQYLSFQVGGTVYGMPISSVREINRATNITPLPETPPYVAGVIQLRGLVIPIIDMRLRFETEALPYTKHTCFVIAETQAGFCGFLVDKILGVQTLTTDHIGPRPVLSKQIKCVNGIGRSGNLDIVLLNMDKILDTELALPKAS